VKMEKLIDGAIRLGITLDKSQIELFEVYYHELVDWNRRTNLTAITGFEDVQAKHFLDSLTITLSLRYPVDSSQAHETGSGRLEVLDVGTGAGFPGVPLKIVLPEISLTLLEATGKKAIFLEHVTRVLGLTDVTVLTARAEDAAHLKSQRGKYGLVVSRAVASMPALLELTLPFCKIGGIFVAQKLAAATPEIDDATRAARQLGGRLEQVLNISLPELSDRCLIVYRKVSPTPEKYPRRPGMPAKQPLT
jgi:16S rRNA (guanine527-N7)-methyltransferase